MKSTCSRPTYSNNCCSCWQISLYSNNTSKIAKWNNNTKSIITCSQIHNKSEKSRKNKIYFIFLLPKLRSGLVRSLRLLFGAFRSSLYTRWILLRIRLGGIMGMAPKGMGMDMARGRRRGRGILEGLGIRPIFIRAIKEIRSCSLIYTRRWIESTACTKSTTKISSALSCPIYKAPSHSPQKAQ